LNTSELSESNIRDIMESIIIFSLSYLPNQYSTIMNYVGEIHNNINDSRKLFDFARYMSSTLIELRKNWEEALNQFPENLKL